jgi:type IV secretory pathway TrbD component
VTEYDENVPPAGEEIHLPGPSVLPLLVAIGITFMVIGLTLSWWFSIFGAVVFLISTAIWVRDTRRDMDDLPEEHRTH